MTSFEAEQAQERRRDQPAEPPAQERSSSERLASAVGNQAFSALARQGAGILPDGRAHPDVESAISQTRGGGQKLDDGSREKIGGQLGDSLDDVRVHTDDHANAARLVGLGARVHDRQRHLLRKGRAQPRIERRAASCWHTSSPTSCSSAAPRRAAR